MENDQKNLNSQETKKKVVNFYLLFELGIEFALMIGLPLGLFVYIGKLLNNKYQVNFFPLIAIFLALPLSSYMIYKKIKEVRDLLK